MIFCNHAARTLWAFSPVECDTNEAAACPNGDLGDLVKRVLTTRQPEKDQLLSIQREDGTERMLLCSAIPLQSGQDSTDAVLLIERDVTWTRNIERDASMWRRQLERVFLDAPVGILILGGDSRIVRVNRVISRMIGGSEDEMKGRSLSDFVCDGGDPARIAALEQLIAAPGSAEGRELRLKRKDQTCLWVRISKTPLGEIGDPAYHAFCVVENIDPNKRAEESLRRSSERFQLIFENIKDYAILTLDEEGRVTSWNPGAERMYGYASPEIVGEHVGKTYTHPERVEGLPDRILEIAKFEGRYEAEALCERKDGSHFWAHVIVNTLRDCKGRVMGFLMIKQDISERKRIDEERLRLLNREIEARKRSEATREQIHLLFRITSALSEERLEEDVRIRKLAGLVVPAFADWCIIDILGKGSEGVKRVISLHADPARQSLAERIGREYPARMDWPVGPGRVFRTCQPEIAESVPEPLLSAIARDKTHLELLNEVGLSSYISVPIPNGNEGPIGVITFSLSEPGRHFSQTDLLTAREIAYRYGLAIEHARLYEKAHQAVVAREETLAHVSHDLKNPISVIILAARLLPKLLEAEDSRKKVIQLGGQILDAAENMRGLIEKLLDVAKMEAGKFTVDFQPQSVRDMLGEVNRLFEPLAAEKGISLRFDISPNLTTVSCDYRQMIRVFSNLLSNALKVSPSSGSIRIGAVSSGERVVFSVEDRGPGIPREQLTRVFDRFWESRDTRRPRGSGLGLAIVKGIVEAHGGAVWVRSEPGQGSTFFFSLPLQPGSFLRRVA